MKEQNQLNNKRMKEKTMYCSPQTLVLELKNEGVICASEINGGNSINNWNDGGTTNDELFL